MAAKDGGEHRPSMDQDMVKGRRTEIEILDGFVAREGEAIGIPTPANVALTDVVKRMECGELEPRSEAYRGSAVELSSSDPGPAPPEQLVTTNRGAPARG